MDGLRVPAVDGQEVGLALDRQAGRNREDLLVVVVEDVKRALVGILQQELDR